MSPPESPFPESGACASSPKWCFLLRPSGTVNCSHPRTFSGFFPFFFSLLLKDMVFPPSSCAQQQIFSRRPQLSVRSPPAAELPLLVPFSVPFPPSARTVARAILALTYSITFVPPPPSGVHPFYEMTPKYGKTFFHCSASSPRDRTSNRLAA